MDYTLLIIVGILLFVVIVKLKLKKSQYQINKEKGDKYEKTVCLYFKNLNYQVTEHGLINGFNDGGIDLIAKKENEILLIQCKNWSQPKSIKEKHIKEFYGSCHFYMENNNLNKNIMSCIYVVPDNKLLNHRAILIFKKNYKKCRYKAQ